MRDESPLQKACELGRRKFESDSWPRAPLRHGGSDPARVVSAVAVVLAGFSNIAGWTDVAETKGSAAKFRILPTLRCASAPYKSGDVQCSVRECRSVEICVATGGTESK